LVAAAVVCQVLGNVVFQWSLGVIGMALTIPLMLGAMIFGAAVLGRLVLREPVTPMMAAALLVLVAAVFVLSAGARQVSGVDPPDTLATSGRHAAGGTGLFKRPDGGPVTPVLLLAGAGAACLAGLAYAQLGVVIRSVVKDSMSVAMSIVTVTLTGVLMLGGTSLLISPGLSAILETPPVDFSFMVLAGLCNAAAFLALTKSLQLIPVAHVNALNATQAGMGALAGIVIFSEPSSWHLWVGVAMTIFGLLLMRGPRRRDTRRGAADA